MRLHIRAEGTPLTWPKVARQLILAPCSETRVTVRYQTWQNGLPCGVNIEYKVNNQVVWSKGPIPCGESGEVEVMAKCNGLHQLAVWGCVGCFWGVEVEVVADVPSLLPVVVGAGAVGFVLWLWHGRKR
ncbi:MAG: hypothetical protein ACO2PN_29325 [Pyrobaculum sp.]|jgi:hypothetical protein